MKLGEAIAVFPFSLLARDITRVSDYGFGEILVYFDDGQAKGHISIATFVNDVERYEPEYAEVTEKGSTQRWEYDDGFARQVPATSHSQEVKR